MSEKKMGLEEVISYLYANPEKNIIKDMDCIDRFSKGEFEKWELV